MTTTNLNDDPSEDSSPDPRMSLAAKMRGGLSGLSGILGMGGNTLASVAGSPMQSAQGQKNLNPQQQPLVPLVPAAPVAPTDPWTGVSRPQPNFSLIPSASTMGWGMR